MSFINNFIISSATSIFVTFISILTNIIVTRSLGPTGRGIYAVISNLIIFLVLIFGEGIKRSNTILVGNDNNQKKYLSFFTLKYSAALSIAFIILFFLNPFYSFLLPNVSDLILIFALAAAIFTVLWQALQALLLGLRKINDYNFLLILQVMTIFLVNVFGIWFFNFEVSEFILTLLLSAAITSIFGLSRLKLRKEQKKDDYSNQTKSIISITGKSTVASLSMFLTLRGDIFLINYFLNPFQAGLYSVAVLFSEIVQKVPNVIGPLVLSKTVNDSSTKPANDTVRLIRVIFIVNIVIVLTLFFVGGWIITSLFGDKFAEAFLPLKYLLPALFFIGPGGIVHAFFMGKAYPPIVIWINLIAGLANIGLNIVFIPSYGISAAALISSITYGIWAISLIIYLSIKYQIKLTQIFFIQHQDFKYLLEGVKKISLKKN